MISVMISAMISARLGEVLGGGHPHVRHRIGHVDPCEVRRLSGSEAHAVDRAQSVVHVCDTWRAVTRGGP